MVTTRWLRTKAEIVDLSQLICQFVRTIRHEVDAKHASDAESRYALIVGPCTVDSVVAKIKCDEERPMCKNCTRRGIECVWINPAPSIHPPSTVSRHTGAGSFDLLTLELMHHYAAATSHSLSSDPAAASVWRIVIPKIAFNPKNQCLLCAILAMSALHAHYADPTAGQYAVAASTYHQQAKTELHRAEADGKTDIDAVFLTLSLVALYEFATSSIISLYSGEWHITIRSIPLKVAKSWPQLQDGVLRPMLVTMAPVIIPTSFEEPFPSSLSTLLGTAHPSPDVGEFHDVSVYDAYKDTIRILKISWKASFQKDYCMYASCMWWSMVPNMYFRLLEERKPRALIILAHYYVMMKRVAEDGPWWVRKQWGNEAARIVSALDVRWTPWLGWLSSQLDQPYEGQPFHFAGTDSMNWLNEVGSLMPPALDFMNWWSEAGSLN
ncbi:uncharacterized protein BT62DRAFT_929123 [Guyanagaster necrorhizus]|uniref:Zn(2)-C6 fungal-type domain-containing protein n=1 Tax=Guyanagaster necrorhizus TaxID=856835 RepID=A0A9P7VX37_9AGAR|nr:uncharacterized protein BT62DRAFT_929123 [Guyanagaster necrorhizus MCA 3950]KAG7449131.1 hypothetical protein BT62DRAFT_929123 [Guyanagaster necrorhizus MCA 3950]